MSITQTQTEPIGTDYEICHSGQRPQPPVISSGGLSLLSLLSFRAEPSGEVEKSAAKFTVLFMPTHYNVCLID